MRRLVFALAGALALTGMVAGGMGWWWLSTRQPPALDAWDAGSRLVADRDGRLLRAFTTGDGMWRLPVSTEAVDPRFIDLLIAYEDKRFRTHPGVDVAALARAAGQALANGRIVSGGSTLTMQTVRLLTPGRSRTLVRKVGEIGAALALERRLGKNDILDIYLARAPYGGNLEGIRAATLAYFGKEPARLSLGEAALMVALPQSPEARRPDRDAGAARRARDRVLDRLASAGALTVAEADAAKAEPVPTGRRGFPMLAAHLARDAVRLAPAEDEIRLTIDRTLQERLERLVSDRVRSLGPNVAAAAIVVETDSGAVRAHVGGAGYFDDARAGQVDLANAVRSPGSALKPFIYALAFEDGLAHPATLIEDRPSRFGAYVPENFDDGFHGTVTAEEALQLSLNVPAVQLLELVGPQRLFTRLRSAGAGLTLPPDAVPSLAVGLGGVGIRLTDLAALYAGLARGGAMLPLHVRADFASVAGGRDLTSAAAAWQVGRALAGAPPPPNASGGGIAFKTGTSYGYRDAWAAGFDGRHTIAVWVGRPDGAPVPGLVGRTVAAPMLFDAFARIPGRRAPLPLAPAEVRIATTAELPRALQRLGPVRASGPATATPPLEIAYPPDGARVALGAGTGGDPLALKAAGGAAPLTWFVDGRPVATSGHRREASWTPPGAGFVRLSVVDAQGRSAASRIRLD